MTTHIKQWLISQTKWVPWASLVGGIVGAAWMERSPKMSRLVFVLALASWLVVFALGFFAKDEAENVKEKATRLIMTWLSQNLVQQSLFFVLPFYIMSTTRHWGHLFFTSTLITVCLLTLWDPWYEKMVATLKRSVILQSFVVFVTVHALGPFIGLTNFQALVAASISAALGAPWIVYASVHKQKRKKQTLIALMLATSSSSLISILIAPHFLPPAPLRMMSGGLGRSYKNHSLMDAQSSFTTLDAPLYCASAIKGPTTMRDVIYHRWYVNGKQTDRVKLVFNGGREKGFRTYSKKNNLSEGVVICQVETSSKQIIKRYRASITKK